jgi:hypothetical protein
MKPEIPQKFLKIFGSSSGWVEETLTAALQFPGYRHIVIRFVPRPLDSGVLSGIKPGKGHLGR